MKMLKSDKSRIN